MAVTKQKKWRIIFLRTYRFIIYDMWRITGNEVSVNRHRLINLVKTIYLSVQRFLADDLQSKAAALTFSTLLAVVPALALVLPWPKGLASRPSCRVSCSTISRRSARRSNRP